MDIFRRGWALQVGRVARPCLLRLKPSPLVYSGYFQAKLVWTLQGEKFALELLLSAVFSSDPDNSKSLSKMFTFTLWNLETYEFLHIPISCISRCDRRPLTLLCLETTREAFLCSRMFEVGDVEHIHSPWHLMLAPDSRRGPTPPTPLPKQLDEAFRSLLGSSVDLTLLQGPEAEVGELKILLEIKVLQCNLLFGS